MIQDGSAPQNPAQGRNLPLFGSRQCRVRRFGDEDGRVVLKVYDLTGREVATLVDEDRNAGVYQQAVFDASRLASGLYFARLQASGKQLVTKMVLMK